MTFNIRVATIEDTEIIFELIKKLAIYEKMENEVVGTIKDLRENIFEKKLVSVLIAEENNIAVGFALYFFNYSTFLGKKGLYLEDVFVNPEYRGKGYGKALLVELAKIAQTENCGRMEWSVLNRNQPAIDFYQSIGAKPMKEWTIYRLDAEKIKNLAEK